MDLLQHSCCLSNDDHWSAALQSTLTMLDMQTVVSECSGTFCLELRYPAPVSRLCRSPGWRRVLLEVSDCAGAAGSHSLGTKAGFLRQHMALMLHLMTDVQFGVREAVASKP